MKARKITPLQREEDGLKPAAPSLPVRIALLALRFYKSYLSILFAGHCRFQPTCSQYAYEAIERFGVARGIWLGLKRLLRCHPLSRKFGYDPVPETPENSSLPLQAAVCGAPGSIGEEVALHESRVTGRQSLHIHSSHLKIQDEVHS